MPAKTTAKSLSSPSPDRSRPLVLASTSRYRKMLLERLGLPFIAVAPGTDETPLAGEAPAATAFRLAEAKARSVAAVHAGALIIGSDQVANCNGLAVGKPETHDGRELQAAAYRRRLAHTSLLIEFTRRRSSVRDRSVPFRINRLRPDLDPLLLIFGAGCHWVPRHTEGHFRSAASLPSHGTTKFRLTTTRQLKRNSVELRTHSRGYALLGNAEGLSGD